MTTDPPQQLRALWHIKSRTAFRSDLIADVGTCSGTAGLHGLFADPDPQYVLVEPQAEFNLKLSNQMKTRRHVIINACLSDRRGVAKFKTDPTCKDSRYLLRTRDRPQPEFVEVRVTTLDDIVLEHTPDDESIRDLDMVVKIDVQGSVSMDQEALRAKSTRSSRGPNKPE